jgi:hypothetical protein
MCCWLGRGSLSACVAWGEVDGPIGGDQKNNIFHTKKGGLVVVDFSVGWNENGTEKMGSYFANLCC